MPAYCRWAAERRLRVTSAPTFVYRLPNIVALTGETGTGLWSRGTVNSPSMREGIRTHVLRGALAAPVVLPLNYALSAAFRPWRCHAEPSTTRTPSGGLLDSLTRNRVTCQAIFSPHVTLFSDERGKQGDEDRESGANPKNRIIAHIRTAMCARGKSRCQRASPARNWDLAVSKSMPGE